jgi:hypothetical protein
LYFLENACWIGCLADHKISHREDAKMNHLPQASDQNFYATMRGLKWSPQGKVIARRAFDRALQQELDAVIESTKRMAAKIGHVSEVWKLERYLTQLRKEIDRKYQYKYSTLVFLFADLIREGKLNAEELQGLAEDKLRYIRHYTGRWVA